MPEKTFSSFEKFINLRIKDYKIKGLKHIGGVNLTVVKLEDDASRVIHDSFAEFTTTSGVSELRLAPQSAAVALKAHYNYIKKNNNSLSDSEITNQAVKIVFERKKRSYLLHLSEAHSALLQWEADRALSEYYSIEVLRDFLQEAMGGLGRLPSADTLDSFLLSESSKIEALRQAAKKKSKHSFGDGALSVGQENAVKFVGGAIAVGIVLIIVVGFFKIVGGASVNSSSGQSGYTSQDSSPSQSTFPSSSTSGNSYAICNARCEPKLQSCLVNTPESQWESTCNSVYGACLSTCR